MGNEAKTHKNLKIWKAAMQLAKAVYEVTAKFPPAELFGLRAQMRQAAVSVPSNLAEGSARASKRELIYFAYVALGSLSELETQWLLAKESKMTSIIPEDSIVPVRKMLLDLIRSLKSHSVPVSHHASPIAHH